MTATEAVAASGRLSHPQQVALRLAGAGLLIATGAIHLDLYQTGYSTIPTIGPLFLLQVVVAFALAVVVLMSPGRVMAAAGAVFAVATLGGYVLSLWVGLFGFTEVRTAAGIAAGIVEVAAFAVLASLALLGRAESGAVSPAPAPAAPPAPASAGLRPLLLGRSRAPASAGSRAPASTGSRAPASAGSSAGQSRWSAGSSGGPSRWSAGYPGAGWGIAIASAVALIVLAVAVGTASGGAPAASGSLQTAQIGGRTVLTNAKGFTLYWFAPDRPFKSNCNGSCAIYWPPVTGSPTAGHGVTGKLGTIKRANGATQATYNGHPLYTYVGDSSPGQAHGNGLNLNGGLWYEVTASG